MDFPGWHASSDGANRIAGCVDLQLLRYAVREPDRDGVGRGPDPRPPRAGDQYSRAITLPATRVNGKEPCNACDPAIIQEPDHFGGQRDVQGDYRLQD